jgi:NAD+ synthase (glutamine-hydrolysing)
MKVCLGQINTTPGDFDGNLAAIKRGIDVAIEGDSDVIVFPELSIPGYLSQDLIYHSGFVDRNLKILDDIVKYTLKGDSKLHVVVGYIERNSGAGKPFLNMAAVINNGEVLGTYQKQLLPFYDVFDELRYFEPGINLLVLDIAGKKVGVAICEDLWNDKGSDSYTYVDNPLYQYRSAGVEVILSLNSSPYVHEKPWQRLSLISPSTVDGLSIVYVNQRGGQDELVFDGQSFVVSCGNLLHQSCEINKDSFDIVDLDTDSVNLCEVYHPDKRHIIAEKSASLFDLLVLCLRDYVVKSGFKSLVLASSGGVDSALVCKLACAAIGPKNVHAVRMPSIYSSGHAKSDAIALHQNLGCWDYEVEIDHQPVLDMLNVSYAKYNSDQSNLVTQKMQEGYSEVADENIQARMRDLYLMHFSNAFGAMPLSTGNKTESACGYYTHFDMNFSFAPIKDLYKYQVVELAMACPEIPHNIWQKPPSAELAPGQTDEESLLPYAILDPIVCAYVEDYVSTFEELKYWYQSKEVLTISMDLSVFENWLDKAEAEMDFHRIVSLIGRMEYKRRQTCPGTKVSKVAFGIGRRIPIVERWS